MPSVVVSIPLMSVRGPNTAPPHTHTPSPLSSTVVASTPQLYATPRRKVIRRKLGRNCLVAQVLKRNVCSESECVDFLWRSGSSAVRLS